MSFVLYTPKDLNYVAFQSFDYQRGWWGLLQKRVVCTKLDIYVFISATSWSEILIKHIKIQQGNMA
jgi:hypothetical protein